MYSGYKMSNRRKIFYKILNYNYVIFHIPCELRRSGKVSHRSQVCSGFSSWIIEEN